MMDGAKRAALEAAGFRFGDYGDFLGLTDGERALIEMRLSLARAVRRLRAARGLTQGELAARMKSTQARVAKIEAVSTEASLDLMFRALFALDGTLADLDGPGEPAEPADASALPVAATAEAVRRPARSGAGSPRRSR